MKPLTFRVPLDKKHCRAHTHTHTHTHVAGNKQTKKRVWHQWTEAVIIIIFYTYSSAYTSAIESNKSGYMTASEEETGGKKKRTMPEGFVSFRGYSMLHTWREEVGRDLWISCRGSFSCLYLASRMHTIYAREKKGKRRVTATVGPETTKAKRGFDGLIHARKVLHILHDTE